MMANLSDSKNILNYWYNLEFFSPFVPSLKPDMKFSSNKKFTLLWKKTNDDSVFYIVYLGLVRIDSVINKVYDSVKLSDREDVVEKDNSSTVLCSIRVSSDGKYIPGSFNISNFIYTSNKVLENKSLDISLLEEEVLEKVRKYDEFLMDSNFSLDYEELNSIILDVSNMFKEISEFISFEGSIYKIKISKNKNGDEDDNQDILSSFYTDDLRNISSSLKEEDTVNNYLLSFYNQKKKINIEEDVSTLEKVIEPSMYPLGKWPSKYNPALMQQVAINLTISGRENIFSVNGPPGSGKTTLLKEIIASFVTDRAILLSKYDNPDDAYTKRNVEGSENPFLKNYYVLDSSISNYGIVVASNNNKAVENISLELPKAEDVVKDNTNTSKFDVNESEEIYFTELANNLAQDKAWGLISTRLGKKTNITDLIQTLWFNKDGKNINSYKGEFSFEDAKISFNKKFSEVINYRKKLEKLKKDVDTLKELRRKIKIAGSDLEKARIALDKVKNDKMSLESKIEELESKINKYRNDIRELNSLIPWYQKIFSFLFRRKPLLIKKGELELEIEKLCIEKIDLSGNVMSLNSSLKDKEDEYREKEDYFNSLNYKILGLEEEIDSYREFTPIADDKFFENIQNNSVSQEKSPWTNSYYDYLREELFYEALNLHKAFITNSKCFYKNLSFLVDIWNCKANANERKAAYSSVLNNFFLLVPVISTTFASVESFLKDIPKESFGLLIIDEAGQATPQSAVGAIYRAKNTVVVGDPFQVEPVVNIPKFFYNYFGDKYGIQGELRSTCLSVQIQADYQNCFGGIRGENNPTWVGCPLLLHRRCINPMFSISNEIAYDGKMFYCTSDVKKDLKLSIKKSIWLDISGREKSKSNHYVKEQGDKVIELLDNAIKKNKGELPSLYIISPFKTVAKEVKDLVYSHLKSSYSKDTIETLDKWLSESCGTVHTFQGKEAKEVIFILGCSSESLGAVRWASKKPNILNVAVTRAKYRLVVIGEADIWKNVPYFDVAYKYLKSK